MTVKIRASLFVIGLVVSACGSGAVSDEPESTTTEPATRTTSATPEVGSAPTDGNNTGDLMAPQQLPQHLNSMGILWGTDWSKATVDLNELLVGIHANDPRDLIPPIDDPVFDTVAATEWLIDQEPGLSVEIEGEARFYPLSVLTRHEIVNDEFGDIPIAVTYCPLCNTGLVFDRRFDGQVLRLGVSGLLRNSDLVMWDDVSQTLWQQITGEGIVGEYAGQSLTPIGSAVVRWADFASTFPEGKAMTDDQGFGRSYGTNPYAYYSSREQPYGFFQGEIDDRYPALERVVGVTVDEASKSYPFSVLEEARAINDSVGGEPIVVFWGAPDTADALDGEQISRSRGIGTAVAFSSTVEGQSLTFEAVNDHEFVDIETGTTWSILGKGTAGPLEGSALTFVPHRNEFWFAWQAFFPGSDVWTG